MTTADHHLQLIFKDKDGLAIANARYQLLFNGQKLAGTTDTEGRTQLVQGQVAPVEIWLLKDGEKPERIGEAKLRPVTQKPTLVARQTERPLVVKAVTEEHSKLPTTKVPLKKYSLQFNVPTFSCTGNVSYRMVQDGKVLAEGKTKGKTMRVYTDSDSEVSLYIAGDKRYKKGEAYVEEMNADKDNTVIQAWAKAKPGNDHKKVEKTAPFNKHDWVDVSKIYRTHPDVIPESDGIYRGNWTPPPKDKERHRRHAVKVDGREVALFWEQGSCDNGLYTPGRKTCAAQNDDNWYMTVDQVIARTHPKVFKVLFEVIKELKLTYVHISSSWRPGIGSSAHREGRALDITRVESATDSAVAKDFLAGGKVIDKTDGPTTNEPKLMEELRKVLYKHPDVEQIFTPWHGMFGRGKSETASFKTSYVLQPVPTKPKPGESEADFKARKATIAKENKEAGVNAGESATLKAHRNHLHFHIKLD